MSHKQFNTLHQKWHQVLSERVVEAEQIAQSSQREGKMSVEQFVQTLVLGCLDPEEVSLRLWSEIADELGCEITASSIDERLTKRAVMLLYNVLQLSIQRQVDVPTLPVEQLEQLSHLILYDSTLLRLPPIFKRIFQGSEDDFGQMKLQVGYDYLTGQLHWLDVQQGVDGDRSDAGLLAQVVKGVLLIFDLGYFNQLTLAKINAQEAFYVTRYQTQTSLYDPQTGEAIDLIAQLQQTDGNGFEITCQLGAKQKTPIRLIARRVSQSEADKRRRKVKRQARQSGYTASQRSLTLCDWEIIITNLSEEWTAQQILDLYRVRWQIELLFKAWKSYLDLVQFGYWRAERVLCQLYATLIGAVLCQSTFASIRYVIAEASLFKAFRIIRRHIIHLLRVIRRNWWGIIAWTKNIRRALLNFGQQQNLETAPSSLRRLINWDLT